MQRKPLLVAIALVGIGIVLGVVLVSSFGSGVSNLFASGNIELGAKQPPVKNDVQIQAMNNAFVSVGKAVMPTVVYINVISEKKGGGRQQMQIPDELKRFFEPFNDEQGGGEAEPRRSESSGSGVFISENGYIITNNHVVEDAKDGGITVTTDDKHEFKAKLIGRDPLTDLAVIKVEGNNFSAAFIGNSNEVQTGEWVVAVGSPLGLKATMTAGIVSAIGRGHLGLNTESYGVENFIQTDAAINPGNSGGGLFDLQGRLVGINSAIATKTGYYQGYGFAIPVNLMKAVALDLIDDGKIDRGYIGVQIKNVDEPLAKALGLDKVAGVVVQSLIKGGAAEKSGLQEEDVILEVDGMAVNTSNELQSLIVQRRAGETVQLKIWRDGKIINKPVTLKPRDEDKNTASKAIPGEPRDIDEDIQKPVTIERFGLTLETLDEKTKDAIEVKSGVLVKKVVPYSEAMSRGVAPGDVIVKVDRKPVNSPKQVKEILENKKLGEAVVLSIKTKQGTKIIGLEVPKGNG